MRNKPAERVRHRRPYLCDSLCSKIRHGSTKKKRIKPRHPTYNPLRTRTLLGGDPAPPLAGARFPHLIGNGWVSAFRTSGTHHSMKLASTATGHRLLPECSPAHPPGVAGHAASTVAGVGLVRGSDDLPVEGHVLRGQGSRPIRAQEPPGLVCDWGKREMTGGRGK